MKTLVTHDQATGRVEVTFLNATTGVYIRASIEEASEALESARLQLDALKALADTNMANGG